LAVAVDLPPFPTRRSSDLEQVDEVRDLRLQQLGQGGVALLVGVGEHDALDLVTTVPEELVLGAAQADALGAAVPGALGVLAGVRSEEHTSELQSRENLVCR